MPKTSLSQVRWFFALTLVLVFSGCGYYVSVDRDEERYSIDQAMNEAREVIQKDYPALDQALRDAPGYAYFDTEGTRGEAVFHVAGILMDASKKPRRFMEMNERPPGTGFGRSKFALLVVFKTEEQLRQFRNGSFYLGNHNVILKTSALEDDYHLGLLLPDGTRLYQFGPHTRLQEFTIPGASFRLDPNLAGGK